MKTLHLSALTILMAIYLSSPPTGRASALSCATSNYRPSDHIELREYVFIGTARSGDTLDVEERPLDPSQVSVDEKIKGELPSQVTVQLSSDWDRLGLEQDQEYLFLFEGSDYNPESSTFTRGICDYDITVATDDERYGIEYLPLLDNYRANTPQEAQPKEESKDEASVVPLAIAGGTGAILGSALTYTVLEIKKRKLAKTQIEPPSTIQ